MKHIRNYVWNVYGEAIRGVEVVVATVFLSAVVSLNTDEAIDFENWIRGVGIACLVAAAAYIKGRLPESPE